MAHRPDFKVKLPKRSTPCSMAASMKATLAESRAWEDMVNVSFGCYCQQNPKDNNFHPKPYRAPTVRVVMMLDGRVEADITELIVINYKNQ